MLRITAPYLSYGIYETAILGFLAHESGWATAARQCVEAAGDIPVVSFGARHVHPAVAPYMDYAAIVGGCATASTPEGARLAGVAPSGTMPHAMIICFGDTVRAAIAFDRHMPPDVPRIVLVDTFRDEPEESVAVAQALGRTAERRPPGHPRRAWRCHLGPGEGGSGPPGPGRVPLGADLRQRRRHPRPHPRDAGGRRARRRLRRRQLHHQRAPHRLHRRPPRDRGQAHRQEGPHPRHHPQPATGPRPLKARVDKQTGSQTLDTAQGESG